MGWMTLQKIVDVGGVGGASVYEFVGLSSIDLCVKRKPLAGKQKSGFSVKYPYHNPS